MAKKYFENLDPQLAELIPKKQAPFFPSAITESGLLVSLTARPR